MKYEAPICEILKFGKEDILTLSGNEVVDDQVKTTSGMQWMFGLSNLNH